MSKVNILSPEVISKIAAGEVIERPASVVKELLENALDAGATAIELHLKDAGKTLIHIKDNGSGIAQDDLDKIFLRHATSKISKADDLFNIHSLGFRGEALYSIGAVADVLVQSRTHDQDSGWEIHLRGGEQKNLKPCMFNQTGTEIKIQELFFNTPARKKFLKSDTAEIGQIFNIVLPYTLLFPEIRFLVTHQNKTLIDLMPTKSRKDRAAGALNLNEIFLQKAASINGSFEIKMVLGDINIARHRRDLQFIFVNGRPVENKNISYHLNNVYRLIMPERTFPFFAVFLNLPAADVDVNVHPTKREVKIRNEQDICAFLRRLCEETLMNKGGAKQIGGHVPSSYPIPNNSPELGACPRIAEPGVVYQSTPTEEFTVPSIVPQEQAELFQQLAETTDKTTLQQKLSKAQFVGSFLNKYLFYQTKDALLIIDQHAAAERVTFERLITHMQKSEIEVQHLLTPLTLKITPREFLVWEETRDILSEFGFETTQFGEQTIAIHSHPVLIRNPEAAVSEILNQGQIIRCDHETIARQACHGSIKTGDRLDEKEITALRKQLLECLAPFTCPHGRPTVIEISESFIAKQFLR